MVADSRSPQLRLEIWSLAWPMVLANIATTLIGLVDTAVLGHLPDPAFIGGAAIATSIFNLIFLSFGFLRMATTGLIAQEFGADTPQGLYTTFLINSFIATFSGVLLLVLSTFIFSFSIPIVGGSENVQTQAWVYSEIRILSAPFVLFNFVGVGFLIGIQKSKLALYIILCGQSVNMFLDFYLGIFLAWHIEGVAWATVISDIVSSALTFVFILPFLAKQNIIWTKLLNWKDRLGKSLDLNRDIFVRTILLLCVFAFITSQSARQGDTILAANSIIIQLFFLIANMIDGFANAAESKAGESVGNKNSLLNRELKDIFKESVLQATLLSSLCLFFIFFLAPWIILLLTNISEIRESFLQYHFWLQIVIFSALVCFVMDGVFVGTTQSKVMLKTIFFPAVFVFIPIWYFFQGFGNHGLWLAIVIFMLVRSALCLFYFKRLSSVSAWR